MEYEPSSAKKGDKPVTFHKKIKSSGYSKAPEAIKFSKKQVQPVQKSLPSMEDRQYLVPFGRTKLPHTLLVAGGNIKFPPIFRHPLTKLRFNYSGTKVAVICADNSVSLLKAGSNQFAEFTNLTGHNGKVNTVDFSANEQLLLTASDDGTARLWNLALGRKQKGNKLLVIREEKQDLIKQPQFLIKRKKVQLPQQI